MQYKRDDAKSAKKPNRSADDPWVDSEKMVDTSLSIYLREKVHKLYMIHS